jgi:hypothetical protein
MRTLVVTQNITADGSIEMLGDWFDPQGQADQTGLVEEVRRQDSHSDAFLTGRHTFEALRSYWPQQSEDPTGITAYLNDVPKYVVSSVISDPQWQNTTVLSGDAVQQVRALTALHNGIDKQSVLVNQPGLDQRVAQRNAAGDHNVLTLLIFQRPNLLDRVSRENRGVLPLRIADH